MKAFKCKKTYYHRGHELMFLRGNIYYGEEDGTFSYNFRFNKTESNRGYLLQSSDPKFSYYLYDIMDTKLFRYGK